MCIFDDQVCNRYSPFPCSFELVVPGGYATVPLLMHFPKLLHPSSYGGCTSHAPKLFICTLMIPIHDTPLHLLSVIANQTNSNRRNNVQRQSAATTTFRSRPATVEYVVNQYVEASVIRNRSGGFPLSCSCTERYTCGCFVLVDTAKARIDLGHDYRHKSCGL